MLHFPTRVFNERIGVFIDGFFEETARLYRAQGWAWEDPARTAAKWQHPDFCVRVAARFKDGAARSLELKLANLPGIVDVSETGRARVRSEHRFRIEIPRSYPSDLGSIVVRAMTALYHPRIGPSGLGEACVYVNGEIDRVLWSIVRQVLLDPDYVQPPRLYRGQDRGINIAAMNWYEADPHGIHRGLLDRWAKAHGASSFSTADKKGRGVEIQA